MLLQIVHCRVKCEGRLATHTPKREENWISENEKEKEKERTGKKILPWSLHNIQLVFSSLLGL